MKYFKLFPSVFVALLTLFAISASAQNESKPVKRGPGIVRSAIGDKSTGVEGKIRLENIGKKQHFQASQKSTYDEDIHSPKSATFSPDGSRLYINSLEGCKTVVYDARTLDKIAVVEHSYKPTDPAQKDLFAPLSGYYEFTHYSDGANRAFQGKPVESTWSHNGRYLWVPFYRRTFDLNAQDPSAIAVIDTRTNEPVRVLETGPLPKMVATSNDCKTIAVTHWGDNTVGFIDISSDNPNDWHHLEPVVIGHKLNLHYSLTSPVNRDSNSGYLLRGTIFTPDDRYLLVSGMSGPLQVIDMSNRKHIGSVPALSSVRHLDIAGGNLYGSQNTAGTVLKLNLDSLTASIDRAKAAGQRVISPGGPVTTVKVGGGARTLSLSPDAQYAFVACNSGNAVYVVDANNMKVVDNIRCDSYPVGLALSPDGHRMVVTSQGRKTGGGNSVNIFAIDRFDGYDYDAEVQKKIDALNNPEAEEPDAETSVTTEDTTTEAGFSSRVWFSILGGILIVVVVALGLGKKKKK